MTEYELNKEMMRRGFVCDKVTNSTVRYYSKFRDKFITFNIQMRYNKNIVKEQVGDSWILS